MFAWLAIRGIILIGKRRKRLGMVGPMKCVMCGMYEEEVDRLLLKCEFAYACKRMVQGKPVAWSSS